MVPTSLLASILASAGLGALIGLIRQWSEQVTNAEDPLDFGGVRTHTFWAVLGCVGAFASRDYTPLAFPVVLAVLSAHLITLRAPSERGFRMPGSTTLAGSLLTVFTGALVLWGHTQAAVLLAATTMVMLGLKQPLHAWTRGFTAQDIRVTLQFVAITGVLLPLVPNRGMGPFEAFNPYVTWLFVVLISGLGFAGYLAMRLFGPRSGMLLTSVLGGLASSTATTLAFSRRSRTEPGHSDLYAAAVIAACTVMLPRIVVAVAVLNPTLAWALVMPLALMALPGVIYGGWFWWTHRTAEADTSVGSPALANPLSLTTAVTFALLYALIAFLVKAAAHFELTSGILPLSFVSGLTATDAISLSMAESEHTGTITLSLATQAVVLATIANSLVKGGFAIALGSPALCRRVGLVLGLTVAAGVAGMVWA